MLGKIGFGYLAHRWKLFSCECAQKLPNNILGEVRSNQPRLFYYVLNDGNF